MTPLQMQEMGEVYLESGFWKLRWRQDPSDADGHVEQHSRKPAWIGPAAGPERLTREEAEQFVSENFIPHPRQNARAHQSAMTVMEFVEKFFAPEHVAKKHVAGRTHYHALLKHILGPAEADRVFRADAEKSMTKLEAVPGWPYMGQVRRCTATRCGGFGARLLGPNGQAHSKCGQRHF
jgi:hypothetical protein